MKIKKVILFIAIVFSGMLIQAGNATEKSSKVLNDFEIAKSIIGRSLAEAQLFLKNNNIKYTSSTPHNDKYIYLMQSANGGHKNWVFIVNRNSIIVEVNLKYVMDRESDIQDLYDYDVPGDIYLGDKMYRVVKSIGTNSSRLIIK